MDWSSLRDKAAEAASSAKQRMSENIDALKTSVGEGVDSLGEKANALKKSISEGVDTLGENFDSLKSSVGKDLDALGEKAASVKQNMSEGFDSFKMAFDEKVTMAKGSLSDAFDAAGEKVSQMGMDLSELTSKVIDNIEEYVRYFSESDLWKKLQENAVKAGEQVVYMALCLFYYLKSEEHADRNTSEDSGEKVTQGIE